MTFHITKLSIALLLCTAAAWPLPALAADPAASGPALIANQWVKLDKAEVKRVDAPLVYEPERKRFMILGGSIGWDEYRKPHPFDELALDLAAGQWENWLPTGKDWGTQFGDSKAPAWKSEHWSLADAAGNCRPNLTVYRGLFLHNQYCARFGLRPGLLLRPRQHLLLRPGSAGLEGPGPRQSPREGRRHAPLGFDVLCPPHQEGPALRRRQRADRTRRSGHLDL